MRTSWRRSLMAMVALPLLAAPTAAAASPGHGHGHGYGHGPGPSAKPSGSTFASVTLDRTSVTAGGCDLTLTYSWRGFHQVWRYGVSIYSGAYPSTEWVKTYGAQTSGSGTATLTYLMPSGTQGTFYGKGTLWTQADNLIAGSFKTTPDLSFSCP